KFTSNGAVLFSTFLGGSGSDSASGVAVDGGGRPYVVGDTEDDTTDFPTTPGAFQDELHSSRDAFVSRLSANGLTLEYSTYLGGNKDDAAFGVDVDSNDNAYVVGQTFSPDFPTGGDRFDPTFNGGGDAFVTEFGP